jgi:hypothetical protein
MRADGLGRGIDAGNDNDVACGRRGCAGARPGTSLGEGVPEGAGTVGGATVAAGYFVFTSVPWPTLMVAPQTLQTRWSTAPVLK